MEDDQSQNAGKSTVKHSHRTDCINNGNISEHANMRWGNYQGILPLENSYRQLMTAGRRQISLS